MTKQQATGSKKRKEAKLAVITKTHLVIMLITVRTHFSSDSLGAFN